LLVTEEIGGEEIIAEDKSVTGAEAGLGTTEDAETKGILTSISRSDESNVAMGILMALRVSFSGTIFSRKAILVKGRSLISDLVA